MPKHDDAYIQPQRFAQSVSIARTERRGATAWLWLQHANSSETLVLGKQNG
jgi:uncharacterized lipoprotein